MFTSLTGSTTAEKVASLGRAAAAGYRAFSVALPPPAARNQGQAYQRDVRQMLEALRSGSKAAFDFVLEVGASLTPGDAASVAATIEPLHPVWFDEPSLSGIEDRRNGHFLSPHTWNSMRLMMSCSH